MNICIEVAILLTTLLFGTLSAHAQIQAPTIQELQDRYPEYLEKSISEKRFEIEDLIPIFKHHNENSEIEFSVEAYSLQDRPIYLAKYGHGDIPILMWSQMHGDESTATMAILDLFNFLASENPADQAFLNSISSRLTLYFIPMLNPDGAAQFQRRNAANIDLNRDALDLSNPESRLLKSVRDSVEPMFGFNLHDQSIYYRAGLNGQQVALAFLAPAYDYKKSVNDVRRRSMQLIANLQDSLQTLIPDRIAVYDDSFEPRAFGDNIQKWGTSTVLIESGGFPNDPEKQFLRELNFLTLIKAMESIMTGSYEDKSIEEYQSIPENERRMLSLIIEDLKVPVNNKNIRIDVGYIQHELEDDGTTFYQSTIVDLGDLSTYSGLKVFHAEDFDLVKGKWYSAAFKDLRSMSEMDWPTMIKNGYLGFILEHSPTEAHSLSSVLITKRVEGNSKKLDLEIQVGKNPTYILQAKETKAKWIVHNGRIYSIDQFISEIEKELEKFK